MLREFLRTDLESGRLPETDLRGLFEVDKRFRGLEEPRLRLTLRSEVTENRMLLERFRRGDRLQDGEGL